MNDFVYLRHFGLLLKLLLLRLVRTKHKHCHSHGLFIFFWGLKMGWLTGEWSINSLSKRLVIYFLYWCCFSFATNARCGYVCGCICFGGRGVVGSSCVCRIFLLASTSRPNLNQVKITFVAKCWCALKLPLVNNINHA